MKIGLAGSTGTILCQTNAVRAGLESFGHTCVAWDDPDAAFVFVGNPPFAQYLEAAKSRRFIFNVLDLAPHCPEHQDIVSALTVQLPAAARATTISESVAAQIAAQCNVSAEVIYYPMKPVVCDRANKYPQFKAAMVGRTSDPNKRCHAAVLSLVKAGYHESEVAIVGPEYPGWGARCGIVSDSALNDIYNSVDYVMMLSKEEGLGLPAAEAACAGAIPIVMPDLSTYNDFWAASPMGLFYQTFTSIDAISRFIIHMDNNPEEKETMKAAMLQYGNIYLRPKFDKVEVARRILNVYHSLPHV